MKELIQSILSGILIHLINGSVYSWGKLKVQIASYQHLNDNTIQISDFYNFIGVSFLIQAAIQWSSSIALEKLNHRLILSFWVALFALSTCYTIQIDNVTIYIQIQSISIGLCLGYLYMIPLIIAWKKHPDQKGIVTGFIIGAFGISGMIFDQIINFIINPNYIDPIMIDDQKYQTQDIAQNVPNLLQKLAIIYLILGTIGILLSNQNIELYGEDKKISLLEIYENFKCQKFQLTQILMILTLQSGQFIVNNQEQQGFLLDFDEVTLSYLGFFGAILNFAGRMTFSIVSDYQSYKMSYVIILSLQILSIMILQFLMDINQIQFASCSVIFFTFGGHFTQTGVQFAKIYGANLGGKLQSIWFSQGVFGNLLNIFLHIIYDEQGFGIILIIFFVLNCISLLLVFNVFSWNDKIEMYTELE